MADPELEAFKTQIDLRQYAASKGYELAARESWRGSAVMRRGPQGGDKIIIKRNANGHHVYFSVHDDADNGTIIDFVQKREGGTLGDVRKALRPWIGGSLPPALPVFQPLEKTASDRRVVEAAYASFDVCGYDVYLETMRHLPAGLAVFSPRFAGRIRMDSRINKVFPHFDEEGLCGYELKNNGFTGFSVGGAKGLWLSHESSRDLRLVFCESAIECLSYATLFPDTVTRFASIGGKTSPAQPNLIAAAVERLPAGEVVAAMNADDEGRKLAMVVGEAFEAAGRSELRFRVEEPTVAPGKDWNDQLRAVFPVPQTPMPDALLAEL